MCSEDKTGVLSGAIPMCPRNTVIFEVILDFWEWISFSIHEEMMYCPLS